MKKERFFYCDVDALGQRSGFIYSVDLPSILVKRECNLYFLAVDLVHISGYIEHNAMLYKKEADATRSALS